MASGKNYTESCTLCDKVNCNKCTFNKEYSNMFEPNEQTKAMMRDGYFGSNDLFKVHNYTMATRAGRASEKDESVLNDANKSV